MFHTSEGDTIDIDELRGFTATVMRYMSFLNEDSNPTDDDIDLKAEGIMRKWDIDKDQGLNKEEF